jgi:hypothetical protein
MDNRLASQISTPLEPGALSEQLVEAVFTGDPPTFCGTQGRLVLHDGPSIGETRFCTLGGTIVVGGAVYILTTAHSFFNSQDGERSRMNEGEKPSILVYIWNSDSFQAFESGPIWSLRFVNPGLIASL